MIMIDLNYTVDLARPVEPKTLTGPLYYGDKQAHRVNVKVLRNGVAVDLTGVSCYAFLVWEETNETFEIEPDFRSVSVSDSTASVVLPEEVYSRTGRCYLLIQLRLGDSVNTVLALYGNITHGRTGIIIIPETSHLDIDAIEALLDDMQTALTNAQAAASEARAAAASIQIASVSETKTFLNIT